MNPRKQNENIKKEGTKKEWIQKKEWKYKKSMKIVKKEGI